MTNLGKNREEIIYELLISINQGNCGYLRDSDDEATPRIQLAVSQYDALVKMGVIKDVK